MKKRIVRAKRYACLIVLGLILSGCSQKVEGPPNIVVILADDLGWMDTGAYGSDFYETPNIDQLANQGIRFTRAYAASPLCSPTRASILTGMYPARIGMTSATGHLTEVIETPSLLETAAAREPSRTPVSITRLPDDYVTYAELLKDAGYETAFMGKWHLGHPPHTPESQGFNVVVGGRAHPGPPPPGHFFAPWAIDTIPDAAPGTHIADALSDAAIQFIADNRHQPFLLNLWYYDVHAPYQAPADIIEKYKSRTDGIGQDSPTMAAMIEKMDTNIGRVLASIRDQGISSRTVVIFMSDNGGNMYDKLDNTTPTDNAPLRSGKGNNYEGGVRVPLIAAGALPLSGDQASPTSIPSALVTDHTVSSVDLFATILDIAGITDHDSDGQSFLPTLRGQVQVARPVFSHFPHYVYATHNRPNTSVISGEFKLYRFHFDGPAQDHRYELYDLGADPSETHNIAANRPDIVRQLDSMIDGHLAATNAVPLAANPSFTGQ